MYAGHVPVHAPCINPTHTCTCTTGHMKPTCLNATALLLLLWTLQPVVLRLVELLQQHSQARARPPQHAAATAATTAPHPTASTSRPVATPPLVQPAPATAPPDAASDLDEVLQCMKAVLLACTARWGGGAAYLLLMPAIEGLLVADQVSRSGEGPASLAGNKM